MTLHILIARPASQELEEAVSWYERQRPGLGLELYNTVVASMESISAHPDLGTAVIDEPDTRRVLIGRFPYQIVYRRQPGGVLILAVAHMKRRPGFWKQRR